MKIVLIAHNLRAAGGLSVGKNIVATLPEVAPMHDYLMVLPEGCGYLNFENNSDVGVVNVPKMGLCKRIIFDSFKLPGLVKNFKPDWIFGLGNCGMRNPPARQAILFHDPHHIYPESHYANESRLYKWKKRLFRWHLRKCLPKTEVVFCQTSTAKERFSRVFSFDGQRIGICPNAISKFSKSISASKVPALLEPYACRFKLFVLTQCYGHKNIDGIIEMYSKHREALIDTVCVLTISPDQHPIASDVLRRIDREKLGGMVVNVGPLEQKELADYYSACDALFLPTLLESFSGTYLESMHFGRPIITSDLDFAHDVCCDAALYCDPFDGASMRDAIIKCKESSQLRNDLVIAGTERLKTMFRSWPDILRDVLDFTGIDHD